MPTIEYWVGINVPHCRNNVLHTNIVLILAVSQSHFTTDINFYAVSTSLQSYWGDSVMITKLFTRLSISYPNATDRSECNVTEVIDSYHILRRKYRLNYDICIMHTYFCDKYHLMSIISFIFTWYVWNIFVNWKVVSLAKQQCQQTREYDEKSSSCREKLLFGKV